MLKELSVAVGLFVMLGLMVAMNPKNLGDRTAHERTVKVVAKLQGGSFQGAGVLARQGLVLTVAHIFVDENTGKLYPNPQLLVLKQGDIEFRPAILKFYSADKDIAILQFNDEKAIKPLILTRKWAYGDFLSFLGNGDGGDFEAGHTRIMAVDYIKRRSRVDPLFVYPCDTGKPGFSGTGLFNNRGELVGLFELGFANKQCAAIRVTEIVRP